ncbi:MAG TPA: Mrp/NBP35 family ATP-binding protein [Gemmatimonadaceae bacterium]|nr:Mrp/NBP35 family ATP-binding protein [Gemmatimonadaceae bacterium]
MSGQLGEQVAEALRQVVNPRLQSDVITASMIRDFTVSDEGRVRLSMLLSAQDPASLVREVRHAVERVPGVTDVRIDVKDPSQVSGASPAAMPGKPAGTAGRGRALPVMEAPGARPAAPRPAAPTPVAYPHLGRIIAVSSGKGGVGKSTVATNLAIALGRSGARVGLMDADIYGPNIPRMMGVNEPPPVINERIKPLVAFGVKLMSLGFLVERDQPAIWRGPIIMKIISQFLRDVDWGELDYFIVDLPPGTGDAQLSLVQATHVAGALIVTTPQEVAVGDALRGAKMFQRVGVPVLGIIENMSYFVCAHCGEPTPMFGTGGGARLARELGLPLLGEVPFYPNIGIGGDEGRPIMVMEPESRAAMALSEAATRVAEAVAGVPAR